MQPSGAPSARLELSLPALRRRFAAHHRPRPLIFWSDMLASAAVGWAAFAAAGMAANPLLAVGAAIVATLALYRAVLFIHEIAHLKRSAVRGFEFVWNVIVGLPLMVPSLMYVGSHRDHHDITVFGTGVDPEYEPIARWSRLRIVASVAPMFVLPPLLALRWGVLGPLSRVCPPLRTLVVGRLSTLVINARYRRRPPVKRDAWRWALEEAAGALYFWTAVIGVAMGWIPIHWFGLWCAVGIGILVLNHVRTLAAHRYQNRGGRLDWARQLLDSVNLPGIPLLTALAAPVGLRYHGLHHMLPGLPYHELGSVHRALRAELPSDSPYHATEVPGVLAGLGALMRRSARSASDDAASEIRARLARLAAAAEERLSAADPGAAHERSPASQRSADGAAVARSDRSERPYGALASTAHRAPNPRT